MIPSSLEVVALDAPGTVADARRWLRNEITWAPEKLRELAELVLSELVTNAVLHAPGPMRVSASRRDDCLAIEVVDTNVAHLPVVRRYPNEAATGRGMHIVEQVSALWGVRDLAAGKGVWAVLADPAEPEGRSRCVERFSPGSWLLDDPTRALGSGEEAGSAHERAPMHPRGETKLAGGARSAEMASVRVVGLPLWLYEAAQQHNDALLREFQLLASTDPSAHVPKRLLALAEETRRRFAAEGTTVRDQVAAAEAAGAATVDLQVAVPRTSWDLLDRLAAQLDEADEFCRRGDLLTLAAPPILRQLREWYLGQVRAQLSGDPATPWPGPFDPPTTPIAPAADDEERQ